MRGAWPAMLFSLSGVALGLALAWLAWGGDKIPDKTTTQPQAHGTAREPQPHQPPATTEPAKPDRQERSSGVPAVREPAVEGPVSSPAPPAGEGKIAGLITLADGTGVEGIDVYAMPSDGERLLLNDHDDLESLRRQAQNLPRAEERLTARTDAHGRFTLSGVGGGDYRVLPHSEEYFFQFRFNLPLERVRAGDQLEWLARPAAWLPIEVIAPDGSPPAFALITLDPGGDWRRSDIRKLWSPDHPRIRVDPGTYEVRASDDHEEFQRSDSITIELVTGVVPEPLRLELKRRRVLLGQVEPRDDPGLNEFRIVADPKAGGERWWDRVGPDGEFKLMDPKPGAWTLALLDESDKVLDRHEVTVGEGVTRVEMRFPDAGPEDYFNLYVTGPDGEFIPGVRVRVVYYQKDRYWSWPELNRSEDGALRFRKPYRRSGDPVRWWSIEIHHEDYGQVAAYRTPADSNEIRAQFKPPATLVVETPWAPEHADRRSLDLIVAEDDQYQRRRSTLFLDQPHPPMRATTELKARQPGPVTIQLAHYTKGQSVMGNVLVLSSHVVELRPGTQTLHIGPPPPLHELVVRPPAGKSAQKVQLLRPGEARVEGMPNEQGLVVFRAPAGRYLLRVYDTEGQMQVRVPAHGIVEYTATPANAWVVEADHGYTEFTKLGLHAGDIITTINGQGAAGSHELALVVERERKAETVNLALLRQGIEVPLAIPGERFDELLNSGLHLRPILAPSD